MVWIGFKLGTVILSQFVENGAIVTMPNKDNQRFSPFFKDRYQIVILRWFFGFPLKFIDDSFTCLKFIPILEYGRYGLYLVMVMLSLSYCSYVNMKRQQIWNFMSAMISMLKEEGISSLDIAVLLCMPFVNLISNTMYFISFKNDHIGWNKMSRSLSNINEEIHNRLGKKASGIQDRSLIGYSKFFFLWLTDAFSVVLLTICFSTTLISSENISNVEKIVFSLAQSYGVFCYIYPPVSYSADLVVSCLVLETKTAFDKFELLVKSWNMTPEGKSFSPSASDLFQKRTTNSER